MKLFFDGINWIKMKKDKILKSAIAEWMFPFLFSSC